MKRLRIDNLHVEFRTAKGALQALRGVSLELDAGESLGLVGESGCGKTTLARAILRILPPNGRIAAGHVWLETADLVALPIEELRRVRWRRIALVTQSAMNALDPVMRVGEQIVEAIRTHEPGPHRAAWERAGKLFEAVGLEGQWLRRFPHEMSGGMRQRAIIAMAMALDPDVIIADEPTTALDVVIQDQIYAQIENIRRDGRKALILITHDISLVAENCTRMAVMYAGQVIETGTTADVMSAPMHPYTVGLRNAFPDLRSDDRELISIPGAPPSLVDIAPGCSFAPRCPFAQARCHAESPPLAAQPDGRLVACHFAERAAEFRLRGAREETWDREASAAMEGLT